MTSRTLRALPSSPGTTVGESGTALDERRGPSSGRNRNRARRYDDDPLEKLNRRRRHFIMRGRDKWHHSMTAKNRIVVDCARSPERKGCCSSSILTTNHTRRPFVALRRSSSSRRHAPPNDSPLAASGHGCAEAPRTEGLDHCGPSQKMGYYCSFLVGCGG